MKILMVTHRFLPSIGGVQICSYEVSKRLVTKGHDVKLITSSDGGPIYEMIEGIEIIRLPQIKIMDYFGVPYPIFYPNIITKLRKLIKESDIVHSHGHPYLSSFVASLLSKRCHKPFFLTIHNSFIDYHNPLLNTAEKINDLLFSNRTIKNSDVVISISPYIDKYIKSLSSEINSIILYNGIDKIKFFPVNKTKKKIIRNKLGLPNDKLICLTVSRITYKKGIDFLLKIAKRCEHNNIIFLLVGTGQNYKEVKEYIIANNLDSKIILAGFIVDNLLPMYYQASDLFILPSITGEGFPTVITEAFASGLPVISTKSGGQIDLIKDGLNGYLIDYGNEIDTVTKIELLFDDKLREKMGKINRKLVLDFLNWEYHLEKLIDIYKKYGAI